MSVYPRQKTGELLGVLLLAGFLLLSLALVSHSGVDPSGSVSATSQEYANYVGRVGAWISDWLFQALGLSALLLPFPLLLVGYKKLRGRPLDYAQIKLLGFSCVVASLATEMSLLAPRLPDSLNFAPGGILGILLAGSLLDYFNAAGAHVVTGTLLVISLTATTRFSVKALLEWAEGRNWNIFARASEQYTLWTSRRRDRKKLARVSSARQTVVAQRVPKQVLPEKLERKPATLEKTAGAPLAPAAKEPPRVKLDSLGDPAGAVEEPRDLSVVPPRRPLLKSYKLPSLDFLQSAVVGSPIDEKDLIERADLLAAKCSEFDVHGRVLQIHPGPVVTTFEFKPDPGIKYSKITNLEDDLCLALKAESVRIDRIPGKNTVGIEVPNSSRQTIFLREILESGAFQESDSRLTLSLGKLINGNTYVTDLTRMPHLLLAGATGSGKSVALNGMVCSILYKGSPADVRFIMIDPKRLELGVYEGIPHLLVPIVSDPRQAANALNWAVREMEERYKRLAQWGVRNIEQYNKVLEENPSDIEDEETLPYIIIVVDELADLMMTAGKDVEAALTRLAQMARAIGIHLILATQRPSVDVLTGLIKANFPCRISFRVSSKVDSRTIIDTNGAEQLLGLGDMLFLPPGSSRLIRIHGAYLREKEIHQITAFLKRQGEPVYNEEVLEAETDSAALPEVAEMEDDLYQEAARFVVETGKASTSLLQRRLRIGYGRAARLLDMMEHEGVVGPPEGSKPREVLVPPEYFEEVENQ